MRLQREQELSFIEFNYMLLQAYDYVELSRRYGCNLQMGGSDQWATSSPVSIWGRRMGSPQLYALTCCPLLTTAWRQDGQDRGGCRFGSTRRSFRPTITGNTAQHRGRRR